MAKENKFNIGSSTVDASYGIKASFDLETGVGTFAQDVSKFQHDAQRERDYNEHFGIKKDAYRKFATIPDSLALKILEDHGLDLHDPLFMHDRDKMNRLKKILISEYRDLVINT